MDFFKTAAARYSYRGRYADTPVPRDALVKIVQAGLEAPSGCNAQTPVFIVVDEPVILEKMRQVLTQDTVATAPAVIVVATEAMDPIPNMNFEIEDYSAATQNILLAVTASGYASVWLDGVLREAGRAERIAEILNIPSTYTVRVVLPVGVPAQEGARPKKKAFDERAWFNKYAKH